MLIGGGAYEFLAVSGLVLLALFLWLICLLIG
jgi:hypothetical protein